MTERRAFSLQTLLEQVNAQAPNRSKRSDGWIGDKAHRNRKSSHNPNSLGVVLAIDITHDPLGGCDSYKLARDLVSDPDKRLSYVISNSKIASREKGWTWRKYTGANPHDKHVHINVMSERLLYDDLSRWDINVEGGFVDKEKLKPDLPVLRKGTDGEFVVKLQELLGIEADGDFGPKTEKAVRAFQKKHKLTADGIVGPYTWELLEKKP